MKSCHGGLANARLLAERTFSKRIPWRTFHHRMAEIIHHLYTSECQRRFASQVQRFSGGKESERDPIDMVREPGLYVDVD